MGVEDAFPFIATLFVIGVIGIIVYYGYTQAFAVFTPIFANATNNSTATTFQNNTLSALGFLDTGFALLTVLLLLASAFVAFMSRSQPFLIIFAMVFQTVFIILGNAFSGAFGDFIQLPLLAGIIGNFKMTTLIMSNLGLLVLVFTCVVMALNYIKPRDSMFGAE